jgi:predicted TIM-barrel enzyme
MGVVSSTLKEFLILAGRGVNLQTIRYLVVLITGFIAGSRIVDAGRAWHEWHTVLSLSIAALVWWLLRPKARDRLHS